jgi:anthranilate synthase component 2
VRVAIVDNYDSFTFNLVQCVGALGARPVVFRNDQLTLPEVVELGVDRIILSPGPGSPHDAGALGVCRQIIVELGPRIPVLGVCLGHQAICAAFGGRVVRAPEVMHGKTSPIVHDGSELFAGLPQPFVAMRYHSLIAEASSLPACLRVTARTEEGLVMGVRHAEHPLHGVQFHPESIGSPEGPRLVANFLAQRATTTQRS